MATSPLKLRHATCGEIGIDYARPVMVQRWLARSDNDAEPHYHDFVEVMVVVTAKAGARHQTILGETEPSMGDGAVLRPGAWHGYSACRGIEVFNCCFLPDLLQRELEWLREDPAINHLLWAGPMSGAGSGLVLFHLSEDDRARCERRLEYIMHARTTGRRFEVISALIAYLGELAHCIDHRATPGPHLMHPAVREAVRVLEGDLADPWTLAALAELVYLSEQHLTRLFKAQMGLPPLAYLAHRRAERAATLLVHTHDSIAEIGNTVGWPDPNYFARRFKLHFGLPPSAYRARHGAITLKSAM